MAKRFIDTEIWDKQKFCESSQKQKLLTLFITSKCDCIGVFKIAPMIINAYIGESVSRDEILSIPVNIIEISEGIYWLEKFCSFQYGELKDSCKPHRKYIEMLKSANLFERVLKGYRKGIERVQEKEEDKEEEKEKEKDKEKDKENLSIFDEFRKIYQGTKKGGETEFENFKKKHKDWKEVLPELKSLLICQINQREALERAKQFVPPWKNLQTWINQRCWEDETQLVRKSPIENDPF